MLPTPLRTLAHCEREIQVDVPGDVTLGAVLDAVEAKYPVLRGTFRDQVTQKRRPFIRFFAGEEDLSHQAPDFQLPEPVRKGSEPFVVVGAMSGG